MSPDIHPEDEKSASEAMKSVLSFYGVELQSHASVILGLGFITFALVQDWGTLPRDLREGDPLYGIGYSIMVGIVGMEMVRQIWRLYAFGKLASGIIYVSDSVWKQTRDQWNNRIREGQTLVESWEHLFDVTKAEVIAERSLMLNSKLLLGARILALSGNGNVRLRFWVRVAGFVGAFCVSYVLFFRGFDAGYSILSSLLIGLFISGGYLGGRWLSSRVLRLKGVWKAMKRELARLAVNRHGKAISSVNCEST